MKSLVINVSDFKVNVVETSQLTYSANDSLSFQRGQFYFTAGLVIKNNEKFSLIGEKHHYSRLVECYQVLHEKICLPFSYEQFLSWVQQAIELNSDKQLMLLQLMMVSGPPRSTMTLDGPYGSGFGGDLSQVIVMMKEFTPRPKWSFDTGIHCITVPYQRPNASAKQSNYMGGVLGQSILDCLNLLLCYKQKCNPLLSWEDLRRDVYDLYTKKPDHIKLAYRYLSNELRSGSLKKETIELIECQANDVFDYEDFGVKSYKQLCAKELVAFEEMFFHECFHEVLFVSPLDNNLILEGSTFSLMGIKDNQYVFSPQSQSINDSVDANDGQVLTSTTVQYFKDIIKLADLLISESSFYCTQLSSFDCMYLVSCTRLLFSSNKLLLQPIASVNATPMVIKRTSHIDTFSDITIKELKLFKPLQQVY